MEASTRRPTAVMRMKCFVMENAMDVRPIENRGTFAKGWSMLSVISANRAFERLNS